MLSRVCYDGSCSVFFDPQARLLSFMLRFLSIQHLAVIESVEIDFDAGLNILTGETVAGNRSSLKRSAFCSVRARRAISFGPAKTSQPSRRSSTRMEK